MEIELFLFYNILSRLLIFVHFATTNNRETAKDRKDVFNISV